jgi:hypothetical protein
MNWLLAAVAGVSVLVCLTAFLVFTFSHPVTLVVVALLLWFFWVAARPAGGSSAPGSRAPHPGSSTATSGKSSRTRSTPQARQ